MSVTVETPKTVRGVLVVRKKEMRIKHHPQRVHY